MSPTVAQPFQAVRNRLESLFHLYDSYCVPTYDGLVAGAEVEPGGGSTSSVLSTIFIPSGGELLSRYSGWGGRWSDSTHSRTVAYLTSLRLPTTGGASALG